MPLKKPLHYLKYSYRQEYVHLQQVQTTRSTSKNGYLCGKYFLISRISIMEIFPQHHKQ